jgi:predicted metalloendopeptidase
MSITEFQSTGKYPFYLSGSVYAVLQNTALSRLVIQLIAADYLYWRRIMTAVSDGPTEFRDIQFRFESIMYGLAQQSPRWSTCIAKASGEASGLAYAVGHAYVAENFPEEVKAEADVLVNNVRAAFKELVGESEWMDAATQVSGSIAGQ